MAGSSIDKRTAPMPGIAEAYSATVDARAASLQPRAIWSARGAWLGPVAYLLALAGTLLLASESVRGWAVIVLLLGSLLAVAAWSCDTWPNLVPGLWDMSVLGGPGLSKSARLGGFAWGFILVLLADLLFLGRQSDVFGAAGWCWLAGNVVLLLLAVWWLVQRKSSPPPSSVTPSMVATTLPTRRASKPAGETDRKTPWEVGLFIGLVGIAVLLRVWDLNGFPNNIYPDEIITGTVASGYLNGTNPPVFSTVWPGVELPALWFLMVAGFLKVGGTWLWAIRLPEALFGAAAVVPFYFLLRDSWGKGAALVGTTVMAFSASNVHFSRLALNNDVTPVFWATCFLFMLRGLRTGKLAYWLLAGLAGGLSEHFYYGTRLLPFVLLTFLIYMLATHWRQARGIGAGFLVLALGYLSAFGPLLVYFLTHPDLYYGRGAGLMIWNRIPTNWDDLGAMWHTLWPVAAQNLLGISTATSQDIMYFGTLLLPAEAALLALGFGLLVWRWKNPLAFLMLLSGLGVLFVGGTLVLYPNSEPPLIAHWTPAFPAFYATLAAPVGAWLAASRRRLPAVGRFAASLIVVAGLALLCWLNIDYYFRHYYADPESLRSPSYRGAQVNYELQTAQSRYMASLGPTYRVYTVGPPAAVYDAGTTIYLVHDQVYGTIADPQSSLPLPAAAGKGLSFIFFPANQGLLSLVAQVYPGGKSGEVDSATRKALFFTYELTPNQAAVVH